MKISPKNAIGGTFKDKWVEQAAMYAHSYPLCSSAGDICLICLTHTAAR
jgi:hypothetical protein